MAGIFFLKPTFPNGDKGRGGPLRVTVHVPGQHLHQHWAPQNLTSSQDSLEPDTMEDL